MIACHLAHEFHRSRIEAVERFARRWIARVDKRGGVHHGHVPPAEGASDIAYALFSFPSLAEYEQYGLRFGVDPEFVEADGIRDSSGGVRRHQRTFMRPVLEA